MPILGSFAAASARGLRTAASGGNDTFTKLLLHCDGVDASTTFTDSSAAARTITVVGNAQIDTAQSKFGGASGLFDGTGDYLAAADHADWDFASGDFTVDLWVRFNNVGVNRYMVTHGDAPADGNGWHLYYAPGDGGFAFAYNATIVTRAWSPSTGTWYHIAVVRNGSDLKLFVDGTQLGTTATISTTITDNTSLLTIGDRGGISGNSMNGWFDEIRVSKGIARWTANFTPPTAPYF